MLDRPRTTFSASRPLAAAALCLALASCMYRPSRLDGPPPLDIPGAYAEASGSEETTAPGIDRWWKMFGDDHLNSLVQKALSDNFDLRQAWSRHG